MPEEKSLASLSVGENFKFKFATQNKRNPLSEEFRNHIHAYGRWPEIVSIPESIYRSWIAMHSLVHKL